MQTGLNIDRQLTWQEKNSAISSGCQKHLLNIAVNGLFLVRNLHQERAIYCVQVEALASLSLCIPFYLMQVL